MFAQGFGGEGVPGHEILMLKLGILTGNWKSEVPSSKLSWLGGSMRGGEGGGVARVCAWVCESFVNV